ncbi:outer membrane beta-barrel family protein [Porphyromonas somerae]|uniref:outer membrane beta-barrel family protein n=1 Tax=Porphyromonas somerae TaxID=322095 RepID=UPI00037E9AEC|nr:outer membrane beta-barrel family protein [Porphyromonas somerae]
MAEKTKLIIGIILFNMVICYANAQTDSLATKIDSLEKVYNLEGVTVTAHKRIFTQKPDRLIFNVENSIVSSGGNALAALKITPGIKVQNEQITMIGKNEMTVMVDERPVKLSGESLINFLRGISSTTIKSIEVISTPPAKYKAQGNSGLVNIILKKAKVGTWSLILRNTYQQATYGDNKSGADFNLRKKKLSISSNISTASGKDRYAMDRFTYYPVETWHLSAPLKRSYNFMNVNFGVDYDASRTLTIGMNYLGHKTNNPFRQYKFNTEIMDANNNMSSYMETFNDKIHKGYTHVLNVHGIVRLDSLGKKIKIDLDYLRNTNKDSTSDYGASYFPDREQIAGSYYANISRNKSEVSNYAAKVDVELPLRWINLNFGGQLDFTTNSNDYTFYDNLSGSQIVDNSQSNYFKYKENIAALYLSASKSLSKRLSMQFGIRVEQTYTEGRSLTIDQANKHHYLNAFPSAYVLYKLSDIKSLSLSYSRRINRPYFYDMNPFKTYTSQYDYSVGNTSLKPSYSDNLDLMLSSGIFVHKVWYSHVSDDYAIYPTIDPTTKIIKRSPSNFINYYSVGMSESYTFNKWWWWNSYNNVTFYYIHKRAILSEAPPMIDRISGNFMTQNDFLLNKKKTWILNFGFYYELPYISSYSKVASNYYFYMGVRTNLLENRLSLSLNVNDIFKTYRMCETMTSNDVRYKYDNRSDTRYLQFSVSYKIGNSSIRGRRHATANENIRRRIK